MQIHVNCNAALSCDTHIDYYHSTIVNSPLKEDLLTLTAMDTHNAKDSPLIIRNGISSAEEYPESEMFPSYAHSITLIPAYVKSAKR